MAETLRMTCSCGATFEATMKHFINGGGTPDEKGRVFIMEIHAEEWRELHAPCVARKSPVDRGN